MTAADDKLKHAAACALADLEGIMPEFEPSGDRTHPAWKTIRELKAALARQPRVRATQEHPRSGSRNVTPEPAADRL